MRTIHRLSHQKLRSLPAGTHGDGGGLYLRVMQGEDDRNGAPTFTRYWLFRYVRNKVNRRIGIGPLADYTLSEAREKARGFRQALDEGRDPQAEQRARRKGKPVANGDEVSFERAAVRFMAANESAWSSAVHRAQWVRSMRKYAYPHIGKMPIGAVDTVAVLTALEPIWTKYPVTADRVRNRIERVWSIGGRIGYDYQGYGLVWGVESDLSWSNFATTGSNSLNLGNLVPGIPIRAGQQNWTEKTNWWGSSNVRVGIPLFADAALLYGLGGVAYGNKDFSGTQSSVAGLLSGAGSGSFSSSSTGFGFDAGIGVELVCLRRGPLRQPR